MLSMNASALLCLVVASLCVAVTARNHHHHDECAELHAVWTFHDVLYLVYGHGDMLGVDSNGESVSYESAYSTGFDYKITAGAGVPDDDVYYLYSYDVEESLPLDPHGYGLYPLYYSGAEQFINDTIGYVSIHAAYTGTNSTITYFYHCNYIKVDAVHNKIISHGKNEDVGLPCHVDAAWRSPDMTIGYISKGDQLYMWHEGEDKADDAVDLYSVFSFMSYMGLCSD